MLFNSYIFLFVFLPVTMLGFSWTQQRAGLESSIIWLVAASLFYYGWWNPIYLVLIVFSMLFNFRIGRAIATPPERKKAMRKAFLAAGITCNLALLGYFKYANFFVDNLNAALGSSVSLHAIVLPLAISFFTFQQIAYLVDVFRGTVREYRFSHYALFVTFFPQLIAGPIVHHAEMMPQFKQGKALRPRLRNFAVGLTFIILGLLKKSVLADGIAAYSSPVFAAAHFGANVSFFEAWGGALAYTFQLYFDFSGYTDMAIGGARLFGIRLPVNFFSPYKATSIIEFWRRWHITLSRFLRDYLYIPLGGNRKGKVRRYANLMITMILGGLWHGAGWTFVLWGTLHGIYLVANHGWHRLCDRMQWTAFRRSRAWRGIAWATTFLAVVVGWVFFRADSMNSALNLLKGMAGLNGVALPNAVIARLGPHAHSLLQKIGIGTYLGGGTTFVLTYLWVACLLAIALFAPNTVQIMKAYRPTVTRFLNPEAYGVEPFSALVGRMLWRPTLLWGAVLALLAAAGILSLSNISEFLYFQF